MAGSFTPSRLFDLGRTRYHVRQSLLRCLDLPAELAEARGLLREHCPELPGIYAFFDAADEPVYVGMSTDLRSRLLCYFFDRSDEAKERRIAVSACRLGWEVAGHPLTASLRELELIRRWKPKYNVKGIRERHRAGYLYLTTDEAPRFKVADSVPRGARRWWGPIPVSYRTQTAIDRLNYEFRLADCSGKVPVRFAEQASLFDLTVAAACMRGQTGTCAAPCVGNCTHAAYLSEVEQACDLLDGLSNKRLEALEAQMNSAAAARRFEHAANLRDSLSELTGLSEQLETLRDLRDRYWFVYPVQIGRRHLWYLVAGGVIARVITAPRCRRTAEKGLAALEETMQRPSQAAFDSHLAQMFLVAGWFRRNSEEMEKAILPDEAKSLCQRWL